MNKKQLERERKSLTRRQKLDNYDPAEWKEYRAHWRSLRSRLRTLARDSELAEGPTSETARWADEEIRNANNTLDAIDQIFLEQGWK